MDTHTIRLIGGSMYFQLPRSFKYKFDLKPGDRYYLIPNADGTVLKFIKAEDEVAVHEEATEAAE